MVVVLGLGIGLGVGVPFAAASDGVNISTGNESAPLSDGNASLPTDAPPLVGQPTVGDGSLLNDDPARHLTELPNASAVESTIETMPAAGRAANTTMLTVGRMPNTSTRSVSGDVVFVSGGVVLPDRTGVDGAAFSECPAAVPSETSSLAVERRGLPAIRPLLLPGSECTMSSGGLNTSVADGSPETRSVTRSSRPSTRAPTRTPTPTPSGAECPSCGAPASSDAPASGGFSPVVGLGLLLVSRLSTHANIAAGLAPLTVSAAGPAVRSAFEQAAHRLPVVPVAPLYSRSGDSDVLDHDDRRAVVAFVRDSPGRPLADVGKQLGLPRSTLRYHVRILEEEQELVTQTVLGRRRLFPARLESPPAVVAAMQDAATRRVLLTLARIEPATMSRVADELEKAPSTVSYHLTRLENANVVARERDGNRTRNRLTPAARAAFETETEGDSTRSEGELPERIRIRY